MIINDKYNDRINTMKSYTNEEFLALYLWQLQHVFSNELSAIKNAKLEFLAFSNDFAETFNLSGKDLCKSLKEIKNVSQSSIEKIEAQELNILTARQAEENIVHFTANQQYGCYGVRKRPLINPSTNDVLGLLIIATKMDLIQSRRLFLNYMISRSYKASPASDVSLTEQQNQIITCLLLGFHSRKEIAGMLSNMTDVYHSETKIRNELHTLFKKFSCKNIDELLNLVAFNKELQLNVSGIAISEDIKVDNIYST